MMRKKFMEPCIYREPALLETGNTAISDITSEREP